MSFEEPITICVPQRDPLLHGDLKKLDRELSSVANIVNRVAGHEILRVQGGGQCLYVFVRDPSESVEGFSYAFELGTCNRTSIGTQEPDVIDWIEACEHIASRLELLLNTIAERLSCQANAARSAARVISVSPLSTPSQAPPPPQG